MKLTNQKMIVMEKIICYSFQKEGGHHAMQRLIVEITKVSLEAEEVKGKYKLEPLLRFSPEWTGKVGNQAEQI